MKKIILMSALPVFAMAAPQIATANETSISRTVEVSDLDLGSDEGRDELDSRVHAAANKICSRLFHGTRSFSDQANCVRATIKKSEGQIARVVSKAQYGG